MRAPFIEFDLLIASTSCHQTDRTRNFRETVLRKLDRFSVATGSLMADAKRTNANCEQHSQCHVYPKFNVVHGAILSQSRNNPGGNTPLGLVETEVDGSNGVPRGFAIGGLSRFYGNSLIGGPCGHPSERTREGLASARAKDRLLGRPKGVLGKSRLDRKEEGIRILLQKQVSMSHCI